MRVLYHEPLSKHTTISVGGKAEVFAYPESEKELNSLFDGRFFIIGGGSNLIFTDDGFSGTIISLERCFNSLCLEYKDKDIAMLRVGAGVSLMRLIREAEKNSLTEIEFLWGIPGTVGGACRTNAGAFGSSFLQFVREVQVIEKGLSISYERNEIRQSYRQGIRSGVVKEVVLELRKKRDRKRLEDIKRWRYEHQPLKEKTAGCIFKNPPSEYAGRLIEQAGLKGKRVGGAGISERHANFIVNYGDAKASDVLSLIDLIRNRVYSEFSVELELEVEIVES
ncbi:UDP-N-acetylmuramate dehydrogenase [candidate division WOR-3 bacterium]|nr:UDP-N-acetylmuramate dehydrogenase [candidate division WOR-3 bacterium]